MLAPFAAIFEPTWLLLSAGFDAHRADPITDLGLSAGDFADLTADLLALVPPGRRIVFLEGGYDLGRLGRVGRRLRRGHGRGADRVGAADQRGARGGRSCAAADAPAGRAGPLRLKFSSAAGVPM